MNWDLVFIRTFTVFVFLVLLGSVIGYLAALYYYPIVTSSLTLALFVYVWFEDKIKEKISKWRSK